MLAMMRTTAQSNLDIKALRSYRPPHNPTKDLVQGIVTDPALDPFTPSQTLYGKSPIGMALYGARGDDLGDGDFVYMREDGINALRVIMPRISQAPENPVHRQQHDEALSLLSAHQHANH